VTLFSLFLWVLIKIGYLIHFVLLQFSEAKLWYKPECTGSDSDGHVGPSPRAFHVAVSIDCHMFIFGGRSGGQRSCLCFAYHYHSMFCVFVRVH
jgi:hypothetical protein